MKISTLTLISILFVKSISAQLDTTQFITTDIDNFWKAYDQIITSKDSVQQYMYFNWMFLANGTPGLKSFMDARGYTSESYVQAINRYPHFWNSVRRNTYKAKEFAAEIEVEVGKLKKLYPSLKPAKIYFTIGAMRSGGTTKDGMVLIGSELAFTDPNTDASEFPEGIAQERKKYFQTNPIKNVVLLAVHEYVHTQQKPMVNNLLSTCLYEGVAEFVSTLSTGKPSSTPAVAFGRKNELAVKTQFEKEMFIPFRRDAWLWSDLTNQFDMRDLGYYIGYTICERHYRNSKDEQQAIREMIDLDYSDEAAVEKFVDDTKFFSAPVSKMFEEFDKSRPTVVSIKEFENGSENIDPKLTRITINFSEPMDKNQRGFDYGPLGEDAVITVKNLIGFSEDGKTLTIEVELKPKHHYQTLLTNNFRSASGIPLKAFLIDVKTTGK